MNRLTKNTIPVIVQLAIILYTLRLALPVWGFYMPAVVNVILLAFLYFSIFTGKIRLRAIDFLMVVPIFSVEILSLFYDTPSNMAVYAYSMLQTLIYPLLGLYLIKSDDSKSIRRIFYVVSLAYLVTCVTTYMGCITYPTASRALAAMLDTEDPELYALYVSMNIGSFSFVYAIVLMLPLLIYLIRDKRINIIIGIIALFLVVCAIIITEYAIALLFMIVSFMVFFFPRNFSLKYIITTIVVVSIVFFIAKDSVGHAFETFASNVNSEILAERLNNISEILLGGEKNVEGNLENRIAVYTKSIEAFNASPIWGGGEKKVGGHSFVLDNLGSYGLLGLVAMFFMYSTLYKLFYRRYKQQDFWGYILLTFGIAICFAILNPKDNLPILTLFVPIFAVAFKTEKK